MRNAEQMTFGGGGMECAAHLRGDEAAQARMWGAPEARVLPLWRMKPLIAGEGRDRPARRGATAHFLLTNWLADRPD